MHVRSSKEWAPGREEMLHMGEEKEAAFHSSASLPAPLIIQSVLPLLLSASPLHGKGGGGVRRGVFSFLIYFFFYLLFFCWWWGCMQGWLLSNSESVMCPHPASFPPCLICWILVSVCCVCRLNRL